jgi:hypothetical protein
MLEIFHALMIKIMYTPQVHADFHTESCAKVMPSIHPSFK